MPVAHYDKVCGLRSQTSLFIIPIESIIFKRGTESIQYMYNKPVKGIIP